MRWWWWWLVIVLLAACGEPDPVDPHEVFRPLDIRVVSEPSMVTVYIREPERPCSCESGDFPEIGSCAGISDIATCGCAPAPAFCVHRIAVESDGRMLAEYLPGDNAAGQAPGLFVPELQTVSAPQVVVEGCGARAEIPVGGLGPRPTFTATRAPDDHIQVDWTTDRPAASAIATVSNGLYGELCQAVSPTLELEHFLLGASSSRLFIEVLGLDPPFSYPTPFGDALVYPAGVASQQVTFP
jgi:hypothetical protein